MTFLILQSVHSVTRNPVAVQSMFDLDQEVTRAHQSVTETESQSRAIEDRIRKIDGAARLLPARAYGKPFDTAATTDRKRVAAPIFISIESLIHS